MRRAIALAEQAAEAGEVPVGALVVKDGLVIGEGFNQPITSCDPTGHAEIIALRNASAALQNYRLSGCDLYVTIEPCTMCAGAISNARISRVVYGASDIKGGAVENGIRFFEQPTCHHKPDVTGGVLADEAASLLKDFFRSRRK